MAKKKATGKTTARKSVQVPPEMQLDLPPAPSAAPKRQLMPVIIIGLIVLLAILVAANKGWVVVAVVNGKPIFSWQLNKTLRARFGQQILEGMIGEALIAKEAQKQGLVVSSADVEAKQQEILATLGGNVRLDDLLKFQGLTKEDFHNQIRIQLTVERLLTRDLTIMDSDINNYIATNRALLSATEPGNLREEARSAIISQTVNEKAQSWFSDLRQKAKVWRFL